MDGNYIKGQGSPTTERTGRFAGVRALPVQTWS